MLCGYVDEHQDDWDRYAGALTYVCKLQYTQKDRESSVWVCGQPASAAPVSSPSLSPTIQPMISSKQDYLRRMDDAIQNVHFLLISSQARYQKDFNGSVREAKKSLVRGEFVYIDLRERKTGKLEDKTQGTFQVISTDGNTVTIYRFGVP